MSIVVSRIDDAERRRASAPERKPEWLRMPPGSAPESVALKRLLRKSKLNTVCEEARCPNISECFSRGTATFMILGDICTRGCRFCAVQTGKPRFLPSEFEAEAERVAEAVVQLQLKHVVITSVARDDLEDGGASGFAACISAVKRAVSGVRVEVLIPDFRGKPSALGVVLSAEPDVLNHNLETVPRLYRRVRPGASYRGSLELLKLSKDLAPGISTKTGVMLGLGETLEEVHSLMLDAKAHGVEIFTAGQYLQPSRAHLAVERYVPPAEFRLLEDFGRQVGFSHVFSGPLVRSSYHAEESFQEACRVSEC